MGNTRSGAPGRSNVWHHQIIWTCRSYPQSFPARFHISYTLLLIFEMHTDKADPVVWKCHFYTCPLSVLKISVLRIGSIKEIPVSDLEITFLLAKKLLGKMNYWNSVCWKRDIFADRDKPDYFTKNGFTLLEFCEEKSLFLQWQLSLQRVPFLSAVGFFLYYVNQHFIRYACLECW